MSRPAFAGPGIDLLALLSDANRRRLLRHSKRVEFTAGTVAFRPGDSDPVFLLQSGLIRAYWSAPDGRQASVAFFQSGNLVGGTTIMKDAPSTFIQVIIDSTFTLLDLETVRHLAATETEVSSAIAMHLAERVRGDLRMIAVRSLGNIPERLAYDLLERACRSQLIVGRLEARATHADLADSIGSSREVVSRALKGLRNAGIIETNPGLTAVVDPARLEAMVRAFVI